MATHYVSIMQRLHPADTTGQVWPEPASLRATNKVWTNQVWIFNDDDTNRAGLGGLFRVPENYVGTASIVVEWTAQVTTGNAVWDFDYRAVGGNDTESMDQAGTQESATVTDAAPSAVNERLQAEIPLTSSNLAAGDLVPWKLFIDGSDANCTISEPCTVFDASFKYTDA